MAYRGPTAPVTSVAVGGAHLDTIFAGCWDKDIWSWDLETKLPGKKFKGHTDFVKTIICAQVGGKDVSIRPDDMGMFADQSRSLYLAEQMRRLWSGIPLLAIGSTPFVTRVIR